MLWKLLIQGKVVFMETIDSRKRGLLALNHEIPDRVPIGIGGCFGTSIMAGIYNKLKEVLGFKEIPTKIYDIFGQSAEIDIEVLNALGCDFIFYHRPRSDICDIYDYEWKTWNLHDNTPVLVPNDFNPRLELDGSYVLDTGTAVYKMSKSSDYFDFIKYPYENLTKPSEIKNIILPVIDGYELKALVDRAKRAYFNTEKVVVFSSNISVLESAQYGFGWTNLMVYLKENIDFVKTYMDLVLENNIENLKIILPNIDKLTHVIEVSDDLGMQMGPQISLKMYRDIIKPRQKILYEYIKNNSNIQIMIHSCGSIYDFIPDLIELGVDIINPIQISAFKMNPIKLKKEFGKYICFWGGGVDVQSTLPFADVKEIRNEVIKNIKVFMKGGGYIFSTTHTIQNDSPVDSILSLVLAAKQYGNY